MHRFITTAVALIAVSTTAACTESVERIRPIPIQPSPAAPAAGNHAPVVRSVAIDRVAPGPGDALACIAMGSDEDGDAVEFGYQWHVDGAPSGTDDVLVGPFHSGQTVTCTATPRDGRVAGAAVSSTPFLVRPVQRAAARVAIEPPVAEAGTPLRCGALVDPVAPGVEVAVTWFVNESEVPGAHGLVLAGAAVHAGDAVRCRVALTEDGHTLRMDSEVRRIGFGDQFASVTSLPSAP